MHGLHMGDQRNGRTIVLPWPSEDDLCQVSTKDEDPPAAFQCCSVVTYGTNDPDAAGPDNVGDPRVHLLLSWGNGRTLNMKAKIDAGQAFTVQGTTLNVRARAIGTPRVAGAPPAIVSLYVGRAAAPAIPAPAVTLTDSEAEVLAAGTSAPWVIPPNAYEVQIATSYDQTAARNLYRVQWGTWVGGAFSLQNETIGGGGVPGVGAALVWFDTPRIMVPRSARAMRIINGTVNSTFRPVWRLSL